MQEKGYFFHTTIIDQEGSQIQHIQWINVAQIIVREAYHLSTKDRWKKIVAILVKETQKKNNTLILEDKTPGSGFD